MNPPENENIAKLTVSEEESIKTAMRAIDNGALGIAFVVDENGKFAGLVTDGDVREAILRGTSVEDPISGIMNTQPVVITGEVTEEELLTLQNSEPIKSKLGVGSSLKVPVLDGNLGVKDIMVFHHGGRKAAPLSHYRSRNLKAVKKVLVIGCSGYLGSVLVRKLISRRFVVYGLDKQLYGNQGIKDLYDNESFNFIEGDIRDIKVLMEGIRGCDAVIHLAAIVGDPACKLDAEETITINYLATKIITEVCKYSQINRLVFASTCSVYGVGETPGTLITEGSSLNPVSLYAAMKIKSEMAILEAVDDNFSPTILRMATLYGLSPRMRFDLVVNLFAARAANKEPITIFGGNQWRPLLHLDDAAEAYLTCLEAPIEKVSGQIFNVGSDQQNYMIRELGEIVKGIVPDVQIENRDDQVDERNYSVNFDKITRILGYRTRKSVEDGISEIKQALETGTISNYMDSVYSNYESLSEQSNIV
jgi:nucleoside-diphosphate-sugar epimerase